MGSVTCRAAVLQYIESRDMKTFSKEIHNLHLSLLCSVDIEKAEGYIVKTLENDEKLRCDLSFAFKCLESFSKKLYADVLPYHSIWSMGRRRKTSTCKLERETGKEARPQSKRFRSGPEFKFEINLDEYCRGGDFKRPVI